MVSYLREGTVPFVYIFLLLYLAYSRLSENVERTVMQVKPYIIIKNL